MNSAPLGPFALLDSSPLLLWLAGRVDPIIISKFKHLSMFERDDYEQLDRLLSGFKSLVTTPHVLTVTSNHAHHLKGQLGKDLLQAYARFAAGTEERYQPSRLLSTRNEFIPFGLTDCALANLSDEVTVITTDFRLAGHLQSHGKRVVNFNHLRQARLLP